MRCKLDPTRGRANIAETSLGKGNISAGDKTGNSVRFKTACRVDLQVRSSGTNWNYTSSGVSPQRENGNTTILPREP